MQTVILFSSLLIIQFPFKVIYNEVFQIDFLLFNTFKFKWF